MRPRPAGTRATSIARLALVAGLAAACSERAPDAPAPAAAGAPAEAHSESAPEPPLGAEDLALIQQAVAAMGGKRFELVGPLLAPLLARNPPPADAQFIAGSAAYSLNDYGQAVARLTDAVARKPAYLANAAALGFAHFKLGDFKAARETFERIVAARESAYKAHYGLGLVAVSEGRLADARTHLQRALELQPDYLKARFQMGCVLQQEGRLEEARAEIAAVLEKWPSHEEALYRMAEILNMLGRGEEAAAMASRHAEVYKLRTELGGLMPLLRRGEADADVYLRIGQLNAGMGDDEEAESAVAEGLQRFPGNTALLQLREQLARGARER